MAKAHGPRVGLAVVSLQVRGDPSSIGELLGAGASASTSGMRLRDRSLSRTTTAVHDRLMPDSARCVVPSIARSERRRAPPPVTLSARRARFPRFPRGMTPPPQERAHCLRPTRVRRKPQDRSVSSTCDLSQSQNDVERIAYTCLYPWRRDGRPRLGTRAVPWGQVVDMVGITFLIPTTYCDRRTYKGSQL